MESQASQPTKIRRPDRGPLSTSDCDSESCTDAVVAVCGRRQTADPKLSEASGPQCPHDSAATRKNNKMPPATLALGRVVPIDTTSCRCRGALWVTLDDVQISSESTIYQDAPI